MADRFPHLKDSAFPDLGNVNVYKYANEFDYSRYDKMQMRIQVCQVPWDAGIVHVGQAQITGIGNVVYFDGAKDRDEWFANIPDTECIRFETKYKELHRTLQIDLPIPFDVLSRYNYIVVEYNLFANDDSLVDYESENGIRKWYWFIREAEFIAPNATRAHLIIDGWTTFIYELSITNMILERGHAPMIETTAEEFLANPIKHTAGLLHDDVVNPNALQNAYNAGELIFNSKNVKAVIVSTANPRGSYGSKSNNTWLTDGAAHFTTNGVPSYCAFACNASSLNTLISSIDSTLPQFARTIKAIAFVNSEMLSLGTSFTFCGVACNMVASDYKQTNIIELNKSMFGYDQKYADMAKLYTFPYAYIELSDETGDVTQIRIEQTNGKIEFASCINLVYPWLRISGHLVSSGKGNTRNVSFTNITSRNMPIQGNWYQTVKNWDIPTFGITQNGGTFNDYNTHYDRYQDQIAYTNEYDSSVASANTARTNTNADADTAVSNTDIQNAAAIANTSDNNTLATSLASTSNILTYFNNQQADLVISGTTNNQVAANDRQADVAQSAAVVKGVTSAVGNLLTGNIPGAVGAFVGAGCDVASNMANTAITNELTQANANLQIGYNDAIATQSQGQTTTNLNAQKLNANDVTENNTDAAEAVTANTAATMKANATRTNTTDIANAGRTRNTAQNAIANQIAQAKMGSPEEFGTFANGENAGVKPCGLFANIITQDDYSIAYAGDEFARYGYMYEAQWPFNGNWNIGKYFTYWKVKDFWIRDLQIPDMYCDQVRFLLLGGVTVWRKPEFIGKIDIYKNMEA